MSNMELPSGGTCYQDETHPVIIQPGNNTALGFTNDPPLPKPPKAYKQGQWHPKLRHQRKRTKERP